MKTEKIVMALLFSACSLMVSAQSADWVVEPKYDEITFFAPDMYKVRSNKKVGIINSKGEVLVKAEYDAINLFYEGRTVFVNKNDKTNEWQVMGILSEDGTVNEVKAEYYLLRDYMYFSEGFLPVKDGNGKYGFLDNEGRKTFDFIDDPVSPFSEGLAMVGANETFRWLTTDGEEISVKLKSRAEIYGATNFYNGKCIIWDEDLICYELDNSMNAIPMKNASGKEMKMGSFELSQDFLLRQATNGSFNVPYTDYSKFQEFQNVWIPDELNGKWSYISNDKKLLMPYQYESAGKFSNDVAIAGFNGKKGLLKVVNDNSTFSISASKNRFVYSAGKDVECSFHLNVPEKWEGQKLSIVVSDSDGKQYSVKQSANHDYTFYYNPSASKKQEAREFTVAVNNNNGICLWTGSKQYSFFQQAKSNITIRLNNKDANDNQRCYVTATVRNTSSIPITTTITLSGGGDKASFARVEKTVTIPANSSTTVKSFFTVNKVEEHGWVQGITSEGTSSRLEKILMNPD